MVGIMVRSLGRGIGSACISGHTRSFISTKLRLTDESSDLLTLRHRTIRCVIEEGGREMISPQRSCPRGQGSPFFLLLSCFILFLSFSRKRRRARREAGMFLYHPHIMCVVAFPAAFSIGSKPSHCFTNGGARREG